MECLNKLTGPESAALRRLLLRLFFANLTEILFVAVRDLEACALILRQVFDQVISEMQRHSSLPNHTIYN